VSPVFVVNDDLAFGTELARLLRSNGYEPRVYRSAIDFLLAHEPTLPGCVILDPALPLLDGLQTQAILNETCPSRPVVFVARSATIPVAAAAMRAGSVDFLCKPFDARDLCSAVDEALRIDAANRAALQEIEPTLRRFASLTLRERQVFAQVINGRLNKQIAEDLCIVEKTVKVHRARMMDKMQVRSLPDLIRSAGIIGADPTSRASFPLVEGPPATGLPESTISEIHPRRRGGAQKPSGLAIWSWDVRNDRVNTDAALARLFGVVDGARRPYPLARYLNAMDPEDMPRVAFLIRDAIEGGQDYNAHYRVAHSGYPPRPVVAWGRAEYDRSGNPVRLIGVLTTALRDYGIAGARRAVPRTSASE
jgi:FixJ family two-component response regulator